MHKYDKIIKKFDKLRFILTIMNMCVKMTLYIFNNSIYYFYKTLSTAN